MSDQVYLRPFVVSRENHKYCRMVAFVSLRLLQTATTQLIHRLTASIELKWLRQRPRKNNKAPRKLPANEKQKQKKRIRWSRLWRVTKTTTEKYRPKNGIFHANRRQSTDDYSTKFLHVIGVNGATLCLTEFRVSGILVSLTGGFPNCKPIECGSWTQWR